MPERCRGFSDEFRVYMTGRDWPLDKNVYPLLRARLGKTRNLYSDLKLGRPVAEKFTNAFIDMLLEEHDPTSRAYGDFRRAKLALHDFLRDRGVQSLTQLSRESIIAHICGPISTGPRAATTDYLRRGLRGIGDMLMAGKEVDRSVQRCCNETDLSVDLAVRWMYIRKGQCIAPDGPRLPHAKAERLAAAHMQIGLARYQQSARHWHAFSPWTVVFAREDDQPVGMSIVLPLNDAAYQSIIEGRRATYELTSADFQSPTTNVWREPIARLRKWLSLFVPCRHKLVAGRSHLAV